MAAGTIQAAELCAPRSFNDDYYERMVQVHEILSVAAAGSDLTPVQTAFVGQADLSTPGRALAVASILSRSSAEKVYLIFSGDLEPRRELNQVEELKGSMRLVQALEESGMRVLIGFSSSDVVLWKAAGASDCATGKFFNLRRFTPGRFEEPTGGGGQLAYWFEENLMAFLRESDLRRIVQRPNGLSPASLRNPFGQRILTQLRESPGIAWLALSWRQYLYWFASMERRIRTGREDSRTILRQAERNWRGLEDDDVFMEEQRNDGTWLRPTVAAGAGGVSKFLIRCPLEKPPARSVPRPIRHACVAERGGVKSVGLGSLRGHHVNIHSPAISTSGSPSLA